MPLDRLAALLPALTVEAAGAALEGAALSFAPDGAGGWRVAAGPQAGAVFAARLAWRGDVAALWSGLAVLPVPPGHPLHPFLALVAAEAGAPRCGSAVLLAAHAQALAVHLLRHAMMTGVVGEGVLAGLADPRLARVLVALHDAPGRPWRIEEMAAVAGMSRSAFMAAFRARLGEPPAAYLRRWRLDRARVEMAAGARLGEVARRYGYGAPDAFARALSRGRLRTVRKAAAEKPATASASGRGEPS